MNEADFKEKATDLDSEILDSESLSEVKTEQEFKKNLEDIVSQEAKKQFNDNFGSEITESLEDFQKSLMQKVKVKTFHKLKEEILSQEDNIADAVSQHIILYYRKELLDSLKSRQASITPALHPELQKEREETNVYLGYLPSIESMKQEKYDESSKTALSSNAEELNLPPHNNNAEILTKQFFNQLSTFSIVGFIISTLFLYLVSSRLFFKEPSLAFCSAVALVVTVFCAFIERQYFKQQGLLFSLSHHSLKFRFFTFSFRIFFATVIFGFLFLTDLNYHTMNSRHYMTGSDFWWTGITNKLFGFLQNWVSYSTLTIIQYVGLGLALLFSFLMLFKIFIKQKLD